MNNDYLLDRLDVLQMSDDFYVTVDAEEVTLHHSHGHYHYEYGDRNGLTLSEALEYAVTDFERMR